MTNVALTKMAITPISCGVSKRTSSLNNELVTLNRNMHVVISYSKRYHWTS